MIVLLNGNIEFKWKFINWKWKLTADGCHGGEPRSGVVGAGEVSY